VGPPWPRGGKGWNERGAVLSGDVRRKDIHLKKEGI